MSRKLTVQAFLELMKQQDNIRNLSVIAHVDHGKSTLCDSLSFVAGLIRKENVGEQRFTDTIRQEMEKGVTIKSSSISLVHHKDKKRYLLNVIDSPGHVDFSSEVTAALRASDGSIVVVDIKEGFRAQTDTVLKQSFQERIKPVLMVNKIDRLITLDHTPEMMYQEMVKLIEKTNDRIEILNTGDYMKGYQLSPVAGNVCFGAGRDGLGWSLNSWCRDVLRRRIPELKTEVFVKKLWGEYYWNAKKNKIVKQQKRKDGELNDRTFVFFVLKPIYKLYKLTETSNLETEEGKKKLVEFLKKYDLTMTPNEFKVDKLSVIRKTVFRKFSPAHECLMDMIVDHLPSPVEAMQYRVESLYSGDLSDEFATAMRKCDASGPLMLYVSKNVEIGKSSVSFGRIFSGTIRNGEKVHIYEAEVRNGKSEDISDYRKLKKKTASIKGCYIMLAKTVFDVPFASAGAVVGLTGIEKFVMKTASVSTKPKFAPFKEMKFSVSPVVKVGVSTPSPKHLKHLLKGIRRLIRNDPLLECSIDEDTSQIVIAGAGEFHLELSIEFLQEFVGENVKIVTSPIVVTFKETVIESGDKVLSKAKNKLNRVQAEAEPLSLNLVEMIEEGKFDPMKKTDLSKLRNHGFDKKEIPKIWRFSPEKVFTSVLVNGTKGIPYMNECKEYLKNGFEEAAKIGILCGEELRGVKFTITDGKFHSDGSHRGAGQIGAMARRAFAGAQISAQPRLVEPWYDVEIQTSKNCSGVCYNVLKKRMALIGQCETLSGGEATVINAKIPVLQSFGLVEELREVTSGNAFTSMSFSHYDIMSGDPYDESTVEHKLVLETRKRKGLKPLGLPKLEDYNDRM